MTTLNIYDVTLKTAKGIEEVGGIYLTDEEGDSDAAISLAINMLREEGVSGKIEYISHSVC